LQSCRKTCDIDHSNMLQRETWCALSAFNPLECLLSTSMGARFLLKYPGTLEEAFVALRESAQPSTRRKSNLKAAAGMVAMGVRSNARLSKQVPGVDEDKRPGKGKRRSQVTISAAK
jgi:hypothetical protein